MASLLDSLRKLKGANTFLWTLPCPITALVSFCPLPVTTRELACRVLLSVAPPTHWVVSAVLPLSHGLHHHIFSLGGGISTNA